MCFFFNDTATTEIYTLSLHDALPISEIAAKEFDTEGFRRIKGSRELSVSRMAVLRAMYLLRERYAREMDLPRSEEHTSELQSHSDLVCRLLLEKKKKRNKINT